MPLHLAYRPASLEEFRGNLTTKSKIEAMLKKPDKPHSMLFMGPAGCGKTTLARLIAAQLGCSDMEIHEYNSADQRGIDTIREIIQQCRFEPLLGNLKCYILDEAHGITGAAGDALLKILEETPKHVYFMLCTTAPESLKETIRQRCEKFEVKHLEPGELKALVNWVIAKEKAAVEEFGIDINVGKDVVDAIATAAEGSPRNALVLLDSIVALKPEQQLSGVYGCMLEAPTTIQLCQTILSVEIKGLQKWKEVNSQLLALLKVEDEEKLRRAILGYCQSVLMETKRGKDGKIWFPLNTWIEAERVYKIMACFEPTLFYTHQPGFVLQCFRACQI